MSPSHTGLYDILGGITSPGDEHFGWFLGRRVFRIVKVDIDRNRISADETTQWFELLQPKPFSQHQIFLEFEFSAHN